VAVVHQVERPVLLPQVALKVVAEVVQAEVEAVQAAERQLFRRAHRHG
jgi:hypothetical protein